MLATIIRPTPENAEHTPGMSYIPVCLIEFGLHYSELRINDAGILMYLFNLPTSFDFVEEVFAKQINMSLPAFKKSFKKLQKLGFITLSNCENGDLIITITLPEPNHHTA